MLWLTGGSVCMTAGFGLRIAWGVGSNVDSVGLYAVQNLVSFPRWSRVHRTVRQIILTPFRFFFFVLNSSYSSPPVHSWRTTT
jgi:hypothetical protein